MYNASRGLFLGCYLSKDDYPHLNSDTLSKAELLWQQAEKAAANDPELLARVRQGHLPVRYAFLKNWRELRRECWEQNAAWPLPEPREEVVKEFRDVCNGVPDKYWTKVTAMNEGGRTVDEFLKNAPVGRINASTPSPPVRLKDPPVPTDLTNLDVKACIDLQDNVASIAMPGKLADIYPDKAASDLRAVRMPGDHQEWAFRVSGEKLPDRAFQGRWKVYAVVRIKPNDKGCPPGSVVFAAGVYDNQTKKSMADFKGVATSDSEKYRSYLVGTVQFNPHRDIWVSPAKNSDVKAVWVDRVYLVPAT